MTHCPDHHPLPGADPILPMGTLQKSHWDRSCTLSTGSPFTCCSWWQSIHHPVGFLVLALCLLLGPWHPARFPCANPMYDVRSLHLAQRHIPLEPSYWWHLGGGENGPRATSDYGTMLSWWHLMPDQDSAWRSPPSCSPALIGGWGGGTQQGQLRGQFSSSKNGLLFLCYFYFLN